MLIIAIIDIFLYFFHYSQSPLQFSIQNLFRYKTIMELLAFLRKEAGKQANGECDKLKVFFFEKYIFLIYVSLSFFINMTELTKV